MLQNSDAATVKTRTNRSMLLAIEKTKIPRHHSDHLPLLAVHRDRTTHDGLLAAETPLPVSVIQHHRVDGAGRNVGVAEPAAEQLVENLGVGLSIGLLQANGFSDLW